MLLFGHKYIKAENFYHISSIDDVVKTPPNSIIYLIFDERNLDIIEYLNQNNILFALHVKNISELIFAYNLQASYITVDIDFAKTAQDIAENYLFDAKILTHIKYDEDIQTVAKLGIDGALFPTAIVKV